MIRDNLERTHLADRAVLLQTDAAAAVRRLSAKDEPFDIIFLDPPYDAGLETAVLPLLADSPLVTPDTLIILETRAEREIPGLDGWGLAVTREKKYKSNKHMFLQLKETTP